MPSDLDFMQLAYVEAQKAFAADEVPVGAVLVSNDLVIARGFNQPIAALDPTAHAEIIALRAAAERCNNYRLVNTTLYVTLEPCMMCVGALVHARVNRVVFGAHDPKSGALETVVQALSLPVFNHTFDVTGGVMAEQCGELLKQFFRAKRG